MRQLHPYQQRLLPVYKRGLHSLPLRIHLVRWCSWDYGLRSLVFFHFFCRNFTVHQVLSGQHIKGNDIAFFIKLDLIFKSSVSGLCPMPRNSPSTVRFFSSLDSTLCSLRPSTLLSPKTSTTCVFQITSIFSCFRTRSCMIF